MAKCLRLTDNSWIMRIGDTIGGLLFKRDETYLYMTPTSKSTYNSLDDIEARFGKLVFVERETQVKDTTLNGYPLKHFDIEIVSENPPLYRKAGGKAEFAAGYWGLKFNQGWTQAFCPKKQTLDTNEHVGPFKNRLEMINHLNALNTRMNLDE